MRKTIDLTESDIKRVTEFQQKNQIKNFSEAVRNIIRQKKCSCGEKGHDKPDLTQINKKLDIILDNLAPPKGAGEV